MPGEYGITGERQLQIEELTRLEGTISQNIVKFYEVGAALAAIREQELFRVVGDPDFPTYCRRKWGWGQSRAEQLMAAARVISVIRAQDMLDGRTGAVADGDQLTNVSPRPLPENEAQTRMLNRAPPDQIVETWDELVEKQGTETIVASDVELAVNKRRAASGDRRYERQEERHHTSQFGVPDETPGQRRNRIRNQCDKGMGRFTDAVRLIPPAEVVPVLDGEYRGKLKRQVRDLKSWCVAVDTEMARQLPLVEGR